MTSLPFIVIDDKPHRWKDNLLCTQKRGADYSGLLCVTNSNDVS